jgi:hypothetical protein
VGWIARVIPFKGESCRSRHLGRELIVGKLRSTLSSSRERKVTAGRQRLKEHNRREVGSYMAVTGLGAALGCDL